MRFVVFLPSLPVLADALTGCGGRGVVRVVGVVFVK